MDYRDCQVGEHPMNPATRRMLLAIGAILLLLSAGTVGYIVIEHMPFDDALFMTVITISTVGYEEVKRLNAAGRAFTIALIFTGVGTAYYVFAAVTEMVVGGQLRELLGRSAMTRKIHQLQGHVIVCGYGRFGRVVVGELRGQGTTVVVVESNLDKESELVRADELYVIGSALDERVLDQAGIATASDIVVATASDPDNVYISLSARSKNPTIRIHARAESEIGLKHLELAGADQAISSYHWSAVRIANAIARPSVVDFLNLLVPGRHPVEFSVEEVKVAAGSRLAGKTIAAIEHESENIRIVALRHTDEAMVLVPSQQTEIQAGDLLIAIGSRANLSRLTASGV